MTQLPDVPADIVAAAQEAKDLPQEAPRTELLHQYPYLVKIKVGGKDGIYVPQAIFANFKYLLEHHPKFLDGRRDSLLRLNLDTGRPQYCGRDLVEGVDDAEILRIFQVDLRFSGGPQTAQPATVNMAINAVVAGNPFSPFVDHAQTQAQRLRDAGPEAIAAADKKLDEWTVRALGAPDNEWSHKWGRKLVVMHVMRATQPGCHMRVAFVLSGPPNIGKTPLTGALLGEQNVALVDEANMQQGKDLAILSGRCLSLVFDEGAPIKSMGLANFKAFVSQRTDDYRAPYERTTTRHLRRSVVFVPVNDPRFLHFDHTGNTKAAVLDLNGHRQQDEVFDFDLIAQWRDDMLGAAVIAIEAGESQATFEGVQASAAGHELPDGMRDAVADALESQRMAQYLRVGVYHRQHVVAIKLMDLARVLDVNWAAGVGAGNTATKLGEVLRATGWVHAADSTQVLGHKRMWWMPLDLFDQAYLLEPAGKGLTDQRPERPGNTGGWVLRVEGGCRVLLPSSPPT